MKIHLGCGQRYLDGYVNIDFPPSEHTVQEDRVADVETDILGLRYGAESLEEIRLHHVFEHFPRPIACALLAGWFSWLQGGGLLHIEVPDLRKTSRVMLSPLSAFKKKAVAERHLFGSHEAFWAVHCEGYTTVMLRNMLKRFGFGIVKTQKNAWRGTYNFEIFGEKPKRQISRIDFERIARCYLSDFLVDEGPSEARLLNVWMGQYNDQLRKCWGGGE